LSLTKYSERLSLLSAGGLTALAVLMVAPGASAQGTPPPLLNFQLPDGFRIQPSHQRCMQPGQRLNLQRIISERPRHEESSGCRSDARSRALAAAKSAKLDPYHQVQTLGELEVFDPKPVRKHNHRPHLLGASLATYDPRSAF